MFPSASGKGRAGCYLPLAFLCVNEVHRDSCTQGLAAEKVMLMSLPQTLGKLHHLSFAKCKLEVLLSSHNIARGLVRIYIELPFFLTPNQPSYKDRKVLREKSTDGPFLTYNSFFFHFGFVKQCVQLLVCFDPT